MDKPKYERLKQVIKNNIRDGIWRPGDKIPVENALCEHFGVSKITVRKAKNDLLTEGVLENLPGRKGVFVKKKTRTPATNFIGVAIDNIQNPFTIDMLRGIEDKLWENKLHTILCNASFDIEKVEAYFESLLEREVTGVIFTPVKGAGYKKNNQQILEMLTEKQIPYVLLDRHIPDLLTSFVVSDNRQASKALTKSLLEKGHTQILVLAGVECSSMNDRIQGYLEALREAGLEQDKRLIVEADDILLQSPTQQNGELERIRRLLEETPDFTACYTLNLDLQAALQVVIPKDKILGQDIELVTYDDLAKDVFCLTNRVTLVKQPTYRMGWEAARLLIDMINSPDQPIIQMILQSEIT